MLPLTSRLTTTRSAWIDTIGQFFVRALLLAGWAVLGFGFPASAATRVDLVIDEPVANRDVPWPVTTGVPFPRGELQSVENCRLIDDTGNPQALQAKVAATWDAARSSIRWLTIDFVALPGRKYALEFGPDVKPAPVPARLTIEQGDPLRISTGVLNVEFSQTGAAALGSIRLDLNGDGKFEPDEEVAAGAGGGEHYAIDQDGRRASNAADQQDRRIVVETSGPVRACIRVDGFYNGPDGRRTVAYRTRYHLFAGLGLIKVVDEFRIVASTRGVRWKDIGFSLRRPAGAPRRTVAVPASDARDARILLLKPDAETGSVSSFQTTYRHYGNPECAAAVVEERAAGPVVHQSSERAGAWMQVADDRAAITGSLRWFWQQFPKEWEATPDGLTLHLWSPRGGELDFGTDGIKKFFGPAGEKYLLNWSGLSANPSPIESFFFFAGRAAIERGEGDGLGTRRHHEFLLHFAPAASGAAQGQAYGLIAGEPPAALATGAWNCSTEVFGPLEPRPNPSPYEAIVDRLFDLGRKAQDDFGDYGWWLFGAGPHYSYHWDPETGRHYADARRFEFHTYQKETQLWWNYLRSGERKFLDWALPSENHWVDVAVAHEPTKFHTAWRGGVQAPAEQHWPRGDWSIDSPTHYIRHHDTGEAWLRGQSQFWGSYHRTLETTSLAYYLTGDERFNDVIGYWRDYWGDLAGKTSDSTDFQPWHREQAWHRPTPAGEPVKSWAEMLRDYAPFNSGSRHQLTLLFNLSTLYEHTWDPRVKQSLSEYAAAFLDADHPIGVWRSYDNRGPAHAEAPIMSHYWAPALWKYGRATGDPRMPGIFRRYFDACLAADPFHEDVGIYSNVQIAYGYYLTRDPRHLRPAALELELLLPNAAPLARPEDLGGRLYNPYAPIKSFTGTPRLIWALREAERQGVAIPAAPPLRPQRAPIAIDKPAAAAVTATIWGYDPELRLIGPDGRPFAAQVQTRSYASAIQPFDRTLPGYQVWLHELTIPADATPGAYLIAPRLELAVLALRGSDRVRCNAASPVALHPGDVWYWTAPAGATALQLESGSPGSLRVTGRDGKPLSPAVTPASLSVALEPGTAGQTLRIEGTAKDTVWLRIAGLPEDACWVSTSEVQAAAISPDQVAAVSRPAPTVPDEPFVPGRFGQGVLITPQRTLHLPDHVDAGGQVTRLYDLQQGTIEFWIKRLWDDRLVTVPRFSFLTNGPLDVWVNWKLPVQEWAHVAVVWRPANREPEQTLVHVYVDGRDLANYRNIYWAGYGDRPRNFARGAKWLEEFVTRAPPGAAYVLDDLRISTVPRYADLQADLGSRQAINLYQFAPPTAPLEADKDTTLLFHFDASLKDEAHRTPAALEGSLK